MDESQLRALYDHFMNVTAPPQQGAPIDYLGHLMNPIGMGVRAGVSAAAPAVQRILAGLGFGGQAFAGGRQMPWREEGTQIPGEGIIDPKSGRKIPTLQAIPQKYVDAHGKLRIDSPLPEMPPEQEDAPRMEPRMYGNPQAVTPEDINRWSSVLKSEPNTTTVPKVNPNSAKPKKLNPWEATITKALGGYY